MNSTGFSPKTDNHFNLPNFNAITTKLTSDNPVDNKSASNDVLSFEDMVHSAENKKA